MDHPGVERLSVDVLIVGAGIAGAALACALRKTALSVCLLEKRSGALDTARGDHLRPRTLEILDRWDVLSAFVEAGAETREGAIWYDEQGDVLLQNSMADLDIPHPHYLYLNHESIGDVLLAAALEGERIRLEQPIRNWWIVGCANGSEIRVVRADGSEIIIEAQLVVAADGRNSRARKLFDFASSVHRYQLPIAVFFSDIEHDAANNVRVYLARRGTTVVIPRTGGGSKVGIPVDMQTAARLRQPQHRGAILSDLAPHLAAAETRFADLYPPIYLRSAVWTSGNVVLLGDACHAMHPAQSQGMNTAIECVDALASRLSDATAPLSQRAVKRLLSEYEASVRPLVEPELESNHQSGLQMDEAGPAAYAAACRALGGLQADPKLGRAAAMRAAGYAQRPAES